MQKPRQWAAALVVLCATAAAFAATGGDHDSELAATTSPPSDSAWAAAARVWASVGNHGPGTSGGGSSTLSGETLRAGTFSLDLREDFTEFRHFDRAAAEEQALKSGTGFDALHRAYVTSLSLSYGITDDFQLGVQSGYYMGKEFIDAAPDGAGGVESGKANPSGFMDTWVTAKYRLMSGEPGNLAILGGIKFPTGRHNVLLDNGEKLEPSSQPGTGAIDFQAGLGYSRFLAPRVTLDAGALYTFRTEHDDFTVGDRADLGVAVAYRLTEDIKQFPQWNLFGELTAVILQKDTAASEHNPNSGGTTLFLTPGARIRFNDHTALTLAPSVPVLQDLNGQQDKIRWKFSATLSFSF